MEKYSLIDNLKSEAENNGWVFLAGDDFYQNYESVVQEYSAGQYVLGCDFIASDQYSENGATLTGINYIGSIRFGRKKEDTTQADLDETFIQKHERRLKELKEVLSNFISDFACSNQLSITNSVGLLEINKFDSNIDFVGLQITLNQEDFTITPTTYEVTLSSITGGTAKSSLGDEIDSPWIVNKNTNTAYCATPDTGYRFLRWLLNGIENLTNPLALIITKNYNIVAEFIKTWVITISADGDGTITPESGTYDDQEEITLIATPNDIDTQFDRWESLKLGTVTDNPLSYTVTQDDTIVGYFTALLQIIQDIFGTKPVQSGNDWVFEDQSGNNNNVTILNNPSLNINSANSVQVYTNIDLTSISKFTLRCRYDKTGNYFSLMQYVNGSFTQRIGILNFNDGNLYALVCNGGTSYVTASEPTQNTEVIMVYDGTQAVNNDRIKVYYDGVLQTTPSTGTIPATTSATMEVHLNVGVASDGKKSDGILDYFSVWSEALTQSDIDDIETALTLPSLIENYGCQESAENIVYGTVNGLNALIFNPETAHGVFSDESEPRLIIDGYMLYESDITPNQFLRIVNNTNTKPVFGVNEVPVLVVIGQSNAVGRYGAKNYGIGDLPIDYQGVQTNIKIWWEGDYLTWNPANGAFVDMNVNANTVTHEYTDPANGQYNRGGWSVEQECAHRMLDEYGGTIYVINNSFDGQNIDKWESPSGTMWIELERYITNAIAEIEGLGKTPVFFTSFLQGEADILLGNTFIDAHYGKMKTFINNYRGLSPYLTDSKFSIFRISSASSNAVYGRTVLNNGFDRLSIELNNVFSINTDNRTFQDTIHYDEQGNLDNGENWYKTIIGEIPDYTKIADIPENICSNSGNTYIGIKHSDWELNEKTFDDIYNEAETSTYVPTKTANTISQLIIKQ